jgi:tRNA-dihydrouridine synthase
MLSSRRLPFEDLKIVPETMRLDSETHLVPQILGNEEKYIALSVARLEEWGAQAIDINMGCPVRKALQHNYGVALMGDPEYAWEVVRMTVKHTRLPVSVKLRAGGPGDLKFLVHFAQGLERAGASWLAFHPRTVEQKRRGQADWSQIRTLRSELSIPLIGNGDVQTADDALRLMESTGCDSAMAGRALTARPWMFWQLGEKLGWAPPAGRAGQKAPQTPEEEGAEYGLSLLRFLTLLRAHFKEDLGLRKFRFYVRTGSVWLLFGNQLYALVMKAKTYEETEQTLRQFFLQEQPMSLHTELRQ